MEIPSYLLCPYSPKCLSEALSSFGLLTPESPLYTTSKDSCTQKRVSFYHEYLTSPTVDVKWIVEEFGYTDGDFIEDYVWFYARCFRHYERKCKRVHFFGPLVSESGEPLSFDDEAFTEIIVGSASEELVKSFKKAYRGFLIVRPLPKALVGRTLLRPYGSSADENLDRKYLTTTRHLVNLFGIDLEVESLPFQEQDSVVSACATVALWSCLRQAARIFEVTAPKPAQITLMNSTFRRGRSIPSTGLELEEVCSVIRDSGLEPEVFDLNDPEGSKRWLSIIYAYLHAKIPVFLGVECIENGTGVAMHALAVSGFTTRKDEKPFFLKEHVNQKVPELKLKGLRMTELYVHDDDLGPFSRLFVAAPRTRFQKDVRLQASDPYVGRTKIPSSYYVPRTLVVPVYAKIRVSFIDVEGWVSSLDDLLRETVQFDGIAEWDIVLTSVHNLKRNYKSRLTGEKEKLDRMLRQMPRFLWHVRLLVNESDLLEFTIDATDSAQGAEVYDCIFHNDELKAAMNVIIPLSLSQSENLPSIFRSLAKFSSI